MTRPSLVKQPPRSALHRRGSILIAASWVLIILSALAVVLAQQMRIELIASGNRVGSMQADAVERGAEQFVLSLVDGRGGDAVTVVGIQAEARQVGDGYFWIIRPDPDNPQQYAFGIADEAAKINLNTATSEMLLKLPGMTSDIPDSIIDWRDADSNPSPSGAEDDYYLALPQPYHCKNGPLESVEELLLVRNVTPQLIFGYDTNRNGVLDNNEQSAGGLASAINAGQDDGRGLFGSVTVKSVEPSTTGSTGDARINVNIPGQRLGPLLRQTLSASRFTAVVPLIAAGRPFLNVFDFAVKTKLTSAEFAPLADSLSTDAATVHRGLINVNTAPRRVLACLPGLNDGDAATLISKRPTGTNATTIAWVLDALPHDKAVGVGSYITSRSYVFSADIVGVSGDGRAYKRVRVVVDARQSPPKIVYRKDVTDQGWPLDPSIRSSLRAGQGLPGGGIQAIKGGM